MVGTGLRKDYVHELGRSHDVGFTDVVQERDAWVRESWMRADTLSRAEQLRYEFLSLPVTKRLAAVRAATSGGSVPASYIEELYQVSSRDLHACMHACMRMQASRDLTASYIEELC